MGISKEKSAKLVSIVILTWNRKGDLAEILQIIESDRYSNMEIIVVDNNSTDGTQEMITENFQDVRYIKLEVNSGIAGYNTGFKAASGEYIAVFDSDSYPHPEALTKMVELFEKYPDAGIVAFNVRTPAQTGSEPKIEVSEVQDVGGYHGAGVGFRKEVFRDAGYLYEPFFLYFNEMDHAMRVLKKGYRIINSPAVQAFHKSSEVSRPSRNAPYYYVRNALWLVWRNFPLFPMLSATFYLIYMAVLEGLHQKTYIYLKALKDAFSNIFGVFSGRNPLDMETFRKMRIPFPLLFSRWG